MSQMLRNSAPISNDSKDSQLLNVMMRRKKRKRRKYLEQLRRSSLKRRLSKEQSTDRNREIKNSLKKTLNMLAPIRQENENKTQGLICETDSRTFKKKKICARLLPEPVIGIFKKSVRGEEAQRKAATNFTSYGINPARVGANECKKVNDRENYFSNNKMSCNCGKKFNNLVEDERTEDRRDFYSVYHHCFQPFNVIKGNSKFNTVSSPKSISNCMKVGNNEKERQKYLSKDVQSADMFERQIPSQIVCHCNDFNYHPITLTEKDPIRSPVHQFMPNHQRREKISQKAIGNEVQSIKRWGIAPAFCYEELCYEILKKNSSIPYPQLDNSDPIKIPSSLAALFTEANEQQCAVGTNDETSVAESKRIIDKIVLHNRNSIINNQTASTRCNSSNSSFVRSSCSLYSTGESDKKFNNELHQYEFPFHDIRRISPHHEEQLNFLHGGEINTNDQVFSTNFEEIQPSESVDWSPIIAEQNDTIQRKTKCIPKILQRSNLNLIDSKSYGDTYKISKKNVHFKEHLSDESSYFFSPPKTISNIESSNNSKEIHVGNKSMNAYNSSIPNHKYMTRSNINNYNYFGRGTAMASRIIDNTSTFRDPTNVHNFRLLPLNSSYDFEQTVSNNVTESLPKTMATKPHGHLPSLNQSTSRSYSTFMNSGNYIPTPDINSESLTNECHIHPGDHRIIQVLSPGQPQYSYTPYWHTSNFDHTRNRKTTYPPLNPRDVSKEYRGKNNSNSSVDINSPLLFYFNRSLSSHGYENNHHPSLADYLRSHSDNERKSTTNYLNSNQPRKYYALSRRNDNNSIPQHIPIYLDHQKPQFINEISDKKSKRRMTTLKEFGKPITVLHKLNFADDVNISSIYTREQNNSRSIPMKFNPDFLDNKRDNV